MLIYTGKTFCCLENGKIEKSTNNEHKNNKWFAFRPRTSQEFLFGPFPMAKIIDFSSLEAVWLPCSQVYPLVQVNFSSEQLGAKEGILSCTFLFDTTVLRILLCLLLQYIVDFGMGHEKRDDLDRRTAPNFTTKAIDAHKVLLGREVKNRNSEITNLFRD